ncbi:MAG: cation transporter [Chloroflexi bacterium]|nr:MAG: cation transporter [Chloroflexota bacterium]
MRHDISPAVLERLAAASDEKVTAALVSVAANLLLIVSKLVVGLATGSIAILAEAAHSFLDLGASLSAYAGVRFAARPADETHPFGHQRFENVSGLTQIVLLLATTTFILVEAVDRIRVPRAVAVEWYSFGVIGLSLVVDVAMTLYLSHAARHTGGSPALSADALHFSNDMLAAVAVLVGLAFAAGGATLADPVAAIVVAVIMAGVAVRSGARTANLLADRSPDPETLERVRTLIAAHPDVRSLHDVRARILGSSVYLDACVGLRHDLDLASAHRISHEIADVVLAGAPEVADVLIHPEPEEEK